MCKYMYGDICTTRRAWGSYRHKTNSHNLESYNGVVICGENVADTLDKEGLIFYNSPRTRAKQQVRGVIDDKK